MTLLDFLKDTLAGKTLCGAGGVADDGLVDGTALLSVDDLDALTAEAYNQGALADTLPWEKGQRLVKSTLAEMRKESTPA